MLGVRLWQRTEVSRSVEKVLADPRGTRLLDKGLGICAIALVPGLISAVLLDLENFELFSVPLIIVVTSFIVILTTFVITARLMRRRSRIYQAILEGDDEYRRLLLSQQDPVFKAIFPSWLIEDYIAPRSTHSFSELFMLELNHYLDEAEEERLRHLDALQNIPVEEILSRIQEEYNYKRKLLELANECGPTFDKDLSLWVRFSDHVEVELKMLDIWRESEIYKYTN